MRPLQDSDEEFGVEKRENVGFFSSLLKRVYDFKQGNVLGLPIRLAMTLPFTVAYYPVLLGDTIFSAVFPKIDRNLQKSVLGIYYD